MRRGSSGFSLVPARDEIQHEGAEIEMK